MSALALASCAAPRPRPGAGGEVEGQPLPLLVEVRSWDQAFEQLVARCPSPTARMPALDSDAMLSLFMLVASVGAGGYALSHRRFDTTTGIATGIGVIAVVGSLGGLVSYLRARAESGVAFERQQAAWREAWAADPAGRPALAEAVAATCGEEAVLRADAQRLGPVR